MSSERQELVKYRGERARETLEDARVLAQAKRWNSCINRLYYACFYAVDAMLIANRFSSSKHSGVRGIFNKQFVMTGLVTKSMARIYNDLYEKRQAGDYADFTRFQESQVLPLIQEAEIFVTNILGILKL